MMLFAIYALVGIAFAHRRALDIAVEASGEGLPGVVAAAMR
jgi:hypothetical protein